MKNKQTRELAVCGLSAVRAILACRPGCVRRLFFLPDLLPEFRPLLRAFAGRRALYRMVPEEDLERLSGTVHHQGAVAMIDQPEIPILDAATARAWAGRGERILVLDGLANDHNLGAIARSAAFFGVRNLLLAGTSGPDLVTTSAFRVAEGGMEWVSLHRIPDAGELAQLAGPSLRIMGADPGGAVFARDALAALPSGQALAILLGSEESGLTTVSRAACSALVRIPGSGNLESLNVAQSAAVLLYELAAGQVSRLGEPQQRRPSRPTQRQKPGFPG